MRQVQERVLLYGRQGLVTVEKKNFCQSIVSFDARLGEATYELTQRAQQSRPAVKSIVEIASLWGDEALWFPLPVVLISAHYLLLSQNCFLLGAGQVSSLAGLFGDLGMLSFTEQCFKASFRRVRPAYAKQSSFYCLPGESFSFPSGHASRAAFLAASFVLGRLSPLMACESAWAAFGAFFVAASVALSRVAKGKHYPVDTLGGMALGSALAVLASNLGEIAWSDAKLPCGVLMTVEALAVMAVPKWRCEGSFVHVAIQLLWWISVAIGESSSSSSLIFNKVFAIFA